MKLQNLVNHVTMILDKSGSMKSHRAAPVAFDREIENLKKMSVDMDQETRVSIWLFGDENKLECLAFDMDVMRFKSIKDLWKPNDGSTALRSAAYYAILDAQKIPEVYGDHAHLVYLFTDGGENASTKVSTAALSMLLKSLAENWTVAVLVPDSQGVQEARQCGFQPDSIATWDATSSKGSEAAASQFTSATQNYMRQRATGVRGTRSFFTMGAKAITKNIVRHAMFEISPALYDILPTRKVKDKTQIRDFVESFTKAPYRLGSAYHLPDEPIEIQNHKEILIYEKKTGRVFEGNCVRGLLGLPDHTVKVAPASHPDYSFFVQSKSVNRHVKPESFVLVMK